MRGIKLVGLALVVMAAMASLGATSAFAGTAENPEFVLSKNPLAFGITAAANGAQTLKAPGITINCSSVAVNSGAILFSEKEIENEKHEKVKVKASGDEETLTYSGCSVEGHSECEVHSPGAANGTIATNALVSKLAFKTKAKATAKEAKNNGTVTVFTPKSGNVFVEIELKGSCGFVPKSNKVEGSVVVTNVQGAAEPEKAHSHELSAENQRNYFVNPGAKEETAELTAFSLEASYTGKSKVTAKESGAEFGIEG
jgi:hypothetical protein